MSARRGAGEGAVYKRASDGLWCATVELGRKPDGTRRRKVVTAKTKAAAVAKARTARQQFDAGLPVIDGRRTVADYLTWWLADVLPATGVKPSTVEGYSTIVRAYITPHIGMSRLADLSPVDVRAMLAAIERSGRSPRTQAYARAVLRRALRHAEQHGLVVRNVAALVDGPRHAATKLDDALNADQALAVLDKATGHRLEALAVLVLRLGLRKGEALGLRWADVDLERGELTVTTAKTRAGVRTVPLVAGTAAALAAHRRRQAAERLAAGPAWSDSGLVFTTVLGGQIDGRNALRWWYKLTQDAGVGRRRMHAARHTCATLLLDAGVPLEVVSAILGHASLAITADVYARVTTDAKRRALALLEAASG